MVLQTAYDQGKEAFLSEVEISENPWDSDSEEYWEWKKGWMDEYVETK